MGGRPRPRRDRWGRGVLVLLIGIGLAHADPRPRIITLSPALAEMVFDVGAGPDLVGTVRFSRHPVPAQEVPRVGDAFGLDLSRILFLHPTLILAWKGGTPPATVDALRRLDFRVVSLGASRLRDISRELIRIGQLTGRVRQARQVARAFRTELAKMGPPPQGPEPLRVFYEVARHPLDTIGRPQIISRAIRACGGRNLFDGIDEMAFPVSITSVLERNPELIIVGRPRSVRFWKHFRQLAAVKAGAVDVIPAGLLAQATPRMLRGIRMLCHDLARARAFQSARAVRIKDRAQASRGHAPRVLPTRLPPGERHGP